MSAWTDRILQEFPPDLSRFWIACDPDDLLLDERILYDLQEQGFEVLPFEDSVAFRTEYEERYRAAWDRGEEGTSKALVLQLRGTDVNALPWDYVRMGRKVSLSLADLFPRLSYGVIRQIDSEHHEALFLAHNKHATQPLGEGATKEFILTHIFRFSPYLLSRPEDLWREVLRIHYRGAGLPDLLADHVAAILKNTHLGDLRVAELLSSKSYMLRVVQDAWDRFLLQYGIQSDRTLNDAADASPEVLIPFEHPDVRVIIDTMFLEGALQPVGASGSAADIPSWVQVGLVDNPQALGSLVSEGVKRIAADLPEVEASHRDWVETARRLGEVISRFNGLSVALAEPIRQQVYTLQREADERLKDWLVQHYANLPSLPAAKGPVMVHHVPRYLALRRNAGEERIALLVFDGLAMDQWIQIREHLAAHVPGFSAEEGGCFAWLPTLTSVSRQALFSGLKPREFPNSIETTSQEPSLWTRFWQENGLRKLEIIFQKGMKRTEQLAELEEAISLPTTKVAGIVVDMIDEIVHGAMLGKRGIAGQISAWCDTGFVEKLLLLLTDQGYEIYLTADHGNVDAEGIGRLSQGVVSELRGERVRTYRSEALAASVPPEINAFRFDSPGLPSDFLPLYAGTRGAFVSKGNRIVAHGGISVEELIVPFVKISIKRMTS
ncbi:BREX-3 system phosphatase PglZ [Rhizobium sp. 25PS6]|uniref:BREX-3 system phosphatase PglZ n=1 Tax=Rhizobium sp. 25PS6 TaxID=3075622 RepID=UPI0028FD90F8|nr:BREX-3 system phosphatase PglZ [Rhizobium sp. 25PS6]MDU0365106.1 BREX-3 system phosphatase PglZ [Rhizobium sp. 25PS6]